MSKKSLNIVAHWHTNDGHIGLLINGKEYTYWIDNAKALSFIKLLRKPKCNKGKALAIFKREAVQCLNHISGEKPRKDEP